MDGEITGLLKAWKDGDAQAAQRLVPLIYDDLRRIAAAHIRRERSGHTLTPTALVHESYLKMFPGKQPDYHDRKHFFAAAAYAMRQLLVDHARKRRAEKRGGDHEPVPLDSVQVASDPWDTLALDHALTDLAKTDPRKAAAVELRFFGGLTLEEIGELTGASAATVMRDLRLAEAWLATAIQKT